MVTGFALSTMALTLLPGRETPWETTTRVDKRTRNGLRGASLTARHRAAQVSDALLYSISAFPVVVDALMLAGVKHGDWQAMGQLTLMTTEALLLNAAVTTVVKNLAWRTRPEILSCETQGTCAGQSKGDHYSFFSGHSSMVATAAGASCMYHARMDLYDNRRFSRMTCGVLSTLAVTTGILRIVADRHHFTDVLTGLVVGFGLGMAVPALHLPRRKRRTALSLSPGVGGVSLLGIF